MKKVLFVTNYPSPYRVAFFDKLGENAEVTVLFSDRKENQSDRPMQWFAEGEGGFRGVQLEKKLFTVLESACCADVLDWLKMPWDEIVLCGYSLPTVMLAMLYLRRKKIPFWLEVDGGVIRQDSFLQYRFKRMLVGSAAGWLSTGKATTDYLVHYGAKREKVREYPFSSLWEADILKEPVHRERKQELRRELGIAPTENQMAVVKEARQRAKELLRKKQRFVWNATNLTQLVRAEQINLFESYGASVRIAYLETDWQTNRERNRNREAAVPEVNLEKMLSILEPPSPWEARNVEWITTG